MISRASNFKYHSCLMFIQLETKHSRSTKPTTAAGKYLNMKRRLQDISNQDGFDESHSGKTSPEIRRRRVAMEKRRRDKINEYLDELSQLVPEAAEKVGFTKLEKAEVLEMTVNYVKRLIKERKGTAQTIDLDPEMERKRGFLTCMSHIKSYLEDHNWPLNKKEPAEQKLDYQQYSSGPSVVHSELPRTAAPLLYASEPTPTSSASGQQNVFNKICLDFLKNSSSSVPCRSAEKQQIVDSVPWQQQTGWQENSTDLRSNISENVDDFDLRYGSFMSAINGP